MSNVFSPSLALLILVTALGYLLATAGMKQAATTPGAMALGLILTGLALAAVAEIVLLRSNALPAVYITILALETLLVLGYAVFVGDGFGLRHAVGGALVVAGIALAIG